MTHVCFKGHDAARSLGLVAGGSEARSDERDFRAGGRLFSLSSFSAGVCSCFSVPVLLKSNAVPGVFGVLLALPKLAKAPLPSPNADEAPELVGEATEFADEAAAALKGLLLEDRLPNRFADVVSWLSRLSVRSVLFIDRLSLLLLLLACFVSECWLWLGGLSAYLERRVHRLAGLLSSFLSI